jgi:glycosyltransferase involved in cell wall biosynthesis
VRIAQISPLIESVPPKQYGGTERIVSYLTEELVRQGHDVTLFASGDSETSARLEACCPKALRLANSSDPLAQHLVMFEKVAALANAFDIIHFHTGYLHFPLCRQLQTATVTTHHGRLDITDTLPLYQAYRDLPQVSISDNQRTPTPWANCVSTVYHGLPEDLYSFNPAPEPYLAFLGRISPEKRVDRAIEIAKRAGMKLKIAAKVDKVDQEYFNTLIRPLLQDDHVEYIGEISEQDKNTFLGNALALVFPIDWPEPFGLVMIEAMACGTPTVAYRHGSIPEVIDEGISGFIVDTIDDAVTAVEKIHTLSRQQCRHIFEQRYSTSRMARDYLRVYRRLVNDKANSQQVA